MSLRSCDNVQAKCTSTCSDSCTHVGPPLSFIYHTHTAAIFYSPSLSQYYTIAVGKLNVPKMANFLEVDVFVLVACPENSLLDSSQFYKPVVTPYEMEVACNRWVGVTLLIPYGG